MHLVLCNEIQYLYKDEMFFLNKMADFIVFKTKSVPDWFDPSSKYFTVHTTL